MPTTVAKGYETVNFEYEHLGVALLVVLFLLTSIGMILVVLIQRPQGGGLSGAFGAGGSSGQSAFGARTGDALTISTIVVFLIFMGLAIGLNFAVRPPEPTLPVMSAGAPSPSTDQGAAGDAPVEAPASADVEPPAPNPAPAPEAPAPSEGG